MLAALAVMGLTLRPLAVVAEVQAVRAALAALAALVLLGPCLIVVAAAQAQHFL